MPQAITNGDVCILKFCNLLRDKYGLATTSTMSVEETIAIFLLTLGHEVSNRFIQEWFQHFGENISRQFYRVFWASKTFVLIR